MVEGFPQETIFPLYGLPARKILKALHYGFSIAELGKIHLEKSYRDNARDRRAIRPEFVTETIGVPSCSLWPKLPQQQGRRGKGAQPYNQ